MTANLIKLAVALGLAVGGQGGKSVAPLTTTQAASSQPASPVLDLPSLVARVAPSVATLEVYGPDDKPIGQGSGFFVGGSRLVTSWHVMAGGTKATVRLKDGRSIPVRGVIAEDSANDVILLDADVGKSGVPGLTIAESLPRAGERVAVIGSPLGLEQTVADGIVSAIRDRPSGGTVLQISVPISPGSSGSPVVNSQGHVVGVVKSLMIAGQSLNFATAVDAVRSMKEGKSVPLKKWATTGLDSKKSVAYSRGIYWYDQGDYDRALMHFRKAAAENPNDPDIWDKIGFCNQELRRRADAIAAYERVVRLRPNNARDLAILGQMYLAGGRWRDALTACQNALRLNPDDFIAHYTLGRLYSGREQYANAVQSFQEASRLLPTALDNSWGCAIHCMLGHAWSKLGHNDQAVAAFGRAVQFDPNDSMALHGLTLAYYFAGRHDEAIAAGKRAIKLDPANAKWYDLLGFVYLNAGRVDDAIATLKQAVQLDPTSVLAHLNLGSAYLMNGDRGSALGQYRVLKGLDEDAANDLFKLIYPP